MTAVHPQVLPLRLSALPEALSKTSIFGTSFDELYGYICVWSRKINRSVEIAAVLLSETELECALPLDFSQNASFVSLKLKMTIDASHSVPLKGSARVRLYSPPQVL